MLRYAREHGLPAIAMCVSTTYGGGDWGRTPHGAIIAGAAFGKLPFVMNGIELEAVGVDDAARALILAAEKGRVGERYLDLGEDDHQRRGGPHRRRGGRGGAARPSRFRWRCRTRWRPWAPPRRGCAAPTNSSRWLVAADARRGAGRLRQGPTRIGLGAKAGRGVDSRGGAVLGGPAGRQAQEQAGRLTGLAWSDVTEKLHVDLSGAPQTMLATFYAKALDADLEKPILGDRWAKEIVDRIDYDWSKTTITARNSPAVTTRSAHFDNWARQFLAVHPEAIVLHLGCGLDSRYYRLDPGPGVEWYDVDYPDVADLRRQLFPAREHCHIVAASVTDPAWLADVPADRPDADDRRGADHVPHRGGRRRAAAPHRRARSVG